MHTSPLELIRANGQPNRENLMVQVCSLCAYGRVQIQVRKPCRCNWNRLCFANLQFLVPKSNKSKINLYLFSVEGEILQQCFSLFKRKLAITLIPIKKILCLKLNYRNSFVPALFRI